MMLWQWCYSTLALFLAVTVLSEDLHFFACYCLGFLIIMACFHSSCHLSCICKSFHSCWSNCNVLDFHVPMITGVVLQGVRMSCSKIHVPLDEECFADAHITIKGCRDWSGLLKCVLGRKSQVVQGLYCCLSCAQAQQKSQDDRWWNWKWTFPWIKGTSFFTKLSS